MASNQALLSTVGFVAVVAAVFLLALLSRPGTPGRVLATLAIASVLAVTAALAAAVWIEPVRTELFPWLSARFAEFGKGDLPWVWFAIVLFLLAPPVVMVVDGMTDIRRQLAERRRRRATNA